MWNGWNRSPGHCIKAPLTLPHITQSTVSDLALLTACSGDSSLSLTLTIMSAFEVAIPFTEMASDDYICEQSRCNNVIPRGSLYYPLVSLDVRKAAHKVCASCFVECLQRPGTAIHPKGEYFATHTLKYKS